MFHPIPPGKLARALHPGERHYKAMAMLTAYFDESGIHSSSEVILISGFVATSELWEKFDAEWKENLDTARVPYWHSTEYEARVGPFQGMNEGIRESLPVGLVKVLCKYKPTAIEGAISRKDWDQFKDLRIGQLFKAPYNLCFEYLIQQIAHWSQTEANGEPVSLIFADQKEYKNHAAEIYDLYRSNFTYARIVSGVSFYPVQNLRPLQAADMIAYEMYRLATGTKGRKILKMMTDGGLSKHFGAYDPLALPKLASQILTEKIVAKVKEKTRAIPQMSFSEALRVILNAPPQHKTAKKAKKGKKKHG